MGLTPFGVSPTSWRKLSIRTLFGSSFQPTAFTFSPILRPPTSSFSIDFPRFSSRLLYFLHLFIHFPQFSLFSQFYLKMHKVRIGTFKKNTKKTFFWSLKMHQKTFIRTKTTTSFFFENSLFWTPGPEFAKSTGPR